jgi:hypothetical protein
MFDDVTAELFEGKGVTFSTVSLDFLKDISRINIDVCPRRIIA